MIITENTYMRGEPMTAIETSLSYGIFPMNKRSIGYTKYKTHSPDHVSIGKGDVKSNPAFMKEFFGFDSIIYIISNQIEYVKGFKPNSLHP